MERVRQIAATGIDGIYVDIPYWMTHFDGWEDPGQALTITPLPRSRSRPGSTRSKDLKLGDFADPAFRKWVDFRIQTFTDFMAEIDHNGEVGESEDKDDSGNLSGDRRGGGARGRGCLQPVWRD